VSSRSGRLSHLAGGVADAGWDYGFPLALFSTITTFGTPVDITLDEVAIESYYPADAESAAYFTESGGDARADEQPPVPDRRGPDGH
jgi:hypothetical protein